MSIFTPFEFTNEQRWGLIDVYLESTQYDRNENARKIAENAALPEEERKKESELELTEIPTLESFFKSFVQNHLQSFAGRIEAKADQQSVDVGRMLRQHNPEMLAKIKEQMGVPDIIPPEAQALFGDID
jgi:hypothetical protein